MHVRVRIMGYPEKVVCVRSKLTKIDEFRRIIRDKFQIKPKAQRLFYGGKLLENGFTFHDYNIKLNDVIQVMVKSESENNSKIEDSKEVNTKEKEDSNIAGGSIEETVEPVYEDVESSFYKVDDLIDILDSETGAWFEGKITRIVYDLSDKVQKNNDAKQESPESSSSSDINLEKRLLYKVYSEYLHEETEFYCKFTEIRPRARTVIKPKDLQSGQTVMLNYNQSEPLLIGYWYNFKLTEIKKTRTAYVLVGSIFTGADLISDTLEVKVIDKIYKIEDAVPLHEQTEEYRKLMTTEPEKRTMPPVCQKCKDDDNVSCKECGCNICSRKDNPDQIILCDECNMGFHMSCLNPPLSALPDDDWYCPSCKRDANEVVAPGASKQKKKITKTTRDWGRGMACVGMTKTSNMPRNHFGPIPGIDVGMCWRFRIQLSELGVHCPPVSGIHGRDCEGAYSIVLSGGYEDDYDNGHEFIYTGSGGRDLSGNKRTAEHSCDQTLTRQNRALARNCAVAKVNEEGADAGDNWRKGKPVRVVRSYKMLKHSPLYAPKEGIRYDGIYKVVKYYPEVGISGYKVWKYLLRRDDPAPAPWEKGAKQYPIVYPDGFLEVEAENSKAKGRKSVINTKDKKRPLPENSHSDGSEEDEPKTKKSKPEKKENKGENNKAAIKMKTLESPLKENINPRNVLSDSIKESISNDVNNKKLWDECLSILDTKGNKEFVDHLSTVFLCVICREIAASPVTTPCLHNFCMECIKLALKPDGFKACACCRKDLASYNPEVNTHLMSALQNILKGYDLGRV